MTVTGITPVNNNPGIVPPWLNPTAPAPELWDPKNPIAPDDPDVPRIMLWDPRNPIVPDDPDAPRIMIWDANNPILPPGDEDTPRIMAA